MDKIFIEYDPFSIDSRLVIFSNGQSEISHIPSDSAVMAEQVVALTYAKDIYDVQICGPLAITNEIIRLVKQKEQTNYSQNKINIEGN